MPRRNTNAELQRLPSLARDITTAGQSAASDIDNALRHGEQYRRRVRNDAERDLYPYGFMSTRSQDEIFLSTPSRPVERSASTPGHTSNTMSARERKARRAAAQAGQKKSKKAQRSKKSR